MEGSQDNDYKHMVCLMLCYVGKVGILKEMQVAEVMKNCRHFLIYILKNIARNWDKKKSITFAYMSSTHV